MLLAAAVNTMCESVEPLHDQQGVLQVVKMSLLWRKIQYLLRCLPGQLMVLSTHLWMVRWCEGPCQHGVDVLE